MRQEQVTEYVASDGARFRDPQQCESYERELSMVQPIMNRLPKGDLNAGQYRQHDKEFLLQIKRDLWALVLTRYGKDFPEWLGHDADSIHPLSGVGRVMSDIGGPIAEAWGWLAYFNFDLGREYQQPYYALHPDEALERVD